MEDAEVAARLKVSTTCVYYRRKILEIPAFGNRAWTAADEKLVGMNSDRTIARLLQRSLASVTAKRRELGIPVFVAEKRIWTDAEDAMLGTEPDEQVAMALGRTLAAVMVRRVNFGIELPNPLKKGWTGAEVALKGSGWRSCATTEPRFGCADYPAGEEWSSARAKRPVKAERLD